jgi:hypothetical protein
LYSNGQIAMDEHFYCGMCGQELHEMTRACNTLLGYVLVYLECPCGRTKAEMTEPIETDRAATRFLDQIGNTLSETRSTRKNRPA